MPILIWSLYLIASALNIYSLRSIDLRRMTFIDGILLGCVYYVVVPMFFILLSGRINPVFIMADAYEPMRDLKTTTVILEGMILISALKFVTARGPASRDTSDPRMLNAMLVLFLITSIYSIFNSGVLSGGHWYEATVDAMENNPVLLVVKHGLNFARTAIFGILLYLHTIGKITRKRAIVTGLIIVMIDMFSTFNRITAVYFIIMLLIMVRREKLLMTGIMAFGIFVLPIAGNVWPIFRGVVSATGYTPQGIAEAAEVAFSQHERAQTLADSTNGVFESINFVTLNYVVNSYGKTTPYLMGDMFVRPLTFLLPSLVWSDRPKSFAETLGPEINNKPDLALNSTLFGESVANFGDFWPLALILLLVVYEFAFKMIGGSSRVVGFIAAFIAFAMWRFDTVFGAVSLAMSLALVLLLSTFRSTGSSSRRGRSLLRARRSPKIPGRQTARR